MKELYGDLLMLAKQGHFDVVIHGCNCFCTMGAGIARQIKKDFPAAFAADQQTIAKDKNKLSTYSKAHIQHGDIVFIIVNAYTQYNWRGDGLKADYAAIRRVFTSIAIEFPQARIAYPLIGAGLAGGDWQVIPEIINDALKGLDHTLVRFNPVEHTAKPA